MIPKILHFIWVGDETKRPDQLIQTWAQHHPGWEIRVWGNEDLVNIDWRCRKQMYELGYKDCAAVADVMRWEILAADGGVCVAADSVCLRPLDEELLDCEAFASWENELGAPGVVSCGYVGCHAGNPLINQMVEEIAHTPDIAKLNTADAVGSGLLTRCWRAMNYAALTVLPSHSFMPRHPKAEGYNGGAKSYACELWASSMGILEALPTLDPQAVAARLAQSQATAALASATEAETAAASHAPAPLFSIVIPTYNRAAMLAEALGSALSQEGDDFEVLVIDDGSTDSTQALLQRLFEAARAPGSADMDAACAAAVRSKLRVVRQDNAGTAMARNRGVAEARGEYIVWLDSDDALLPGSLEHYRRCIAQGRGADVMYGNLVVVNERCEPTGRLDYPDYAGQALVPELLIHNRIPNPGTAVRRSLYEVVGGYDEQLPASEDYDLWLRAAAAGASFRQAGGDVVRYRQHDGGRSASAARNNEADALIAMKALQQIPLERLFPNLDWSRPLVARTQAFTVVTQLFVSRGCWREAAEFAASVQLCAAALSGGEVLPQREASLPTSGSGPSGVQTAQVSTTAASASTARVAQAGDSQIISMFRAAAAADAAHDEGDQEQCREMAHALTA